MLMEHYPDKKMARARRPPRSASPPSTTTLVVDFVNTVACPGCQAEDALDSEEGLEKWLQRRFPIDVKSLKRSDLDRLRQLRPAVRSLLDSTMQGEPPSPDDLALVRSLASRFERARELRWERKRWRYGSPATVDGAWVRHRLAYATVELLTGTDVDKVRRCQATGCVHLLFARMRSQVWCSPTGCGNRTRVARHYQKTRARN